MFQVWINTENSEHKSCHKFSVIQHRKLNLTFMLKNNYQKKIVRVIYG